MGKMCREAGKRPPCGVSGKLDSAVCVYPSETPTHPAHGSSELCPQRLIDPNSKLNWLANCLYQPKYLLLLANYNQSPRFLLMTVIIIECLLWAQHYANSSRCIISKQPYKTGMIIINPILQTMKLRHREIN